jgi:hypothetical protein
MHLFREKADVFYLHYFFLPEKIISKILIGLSNAIWFTHKAYYSLCLSFTETVLS